MPFENEDDLKSRSTALLQYLILREACIKNSNDSSIELSSEKIIKEIEETCLDYFYDDFLSKENPKNFRNEIKNEIKFLIKEKKSLNFSNNLISTLQSERIKDMIITDEKIETESEKDEMNVRSMIDYIYKNISNTDNVTLIEDKINILYSEVSGKNEEIFDLFAVNFNMVHSRLATVTSFISGNINFGFNALEDLIKTNFSEKKIPSKSPKQSKILKTLGNLRPRISI
jgi:hypothetical protein